MTYFSGDRLHCATWRRRDFAVVCADDDNLFAAATASKFNFALIVPELYTILTRYHPVLRPPDFYAIDGGTPGYL